PTPSVRELARLGANELGRIPVLEWHDVAETDDRWGTSRATFRRQLQELYDRGYRPVTAAEFARGEFPVAAGRTPVVFTLDDSFRSHLWFGSDGRPHPDSVVGILEAFAKDKPEWRATAAFYIYWPVPFRERDQIDRKLRYLVDNGYELGNHSFNHDDLSKLDPDGVRESLARAQAAVQERIPGYRMATLALPFGLWPPDKSVAVTGQWEGTRYWHDAVFLVGDMPYHPPHHARYDPWHVMRVQSYEFRKWIDWLDAEPGRRFVSDGDPATVAYPSRLQEVAKVRPGFQAVPYD
ncbi:MAG TPA: polysaccharide deacetylase family protein, partial [Actinomycetota bacterium]|nr:polysaccharide deacetylase family protein [Actinomycetota bacterium]